jgi:hypothetical protein
MPQVFSVLESVRLNEEDADSDVVQFVQPSGMKRQQSDVNRTSESPSGDLNCGGRPAGRGGTWYWGLPGVKGRGSVAMARMPGAQRRFGRVNGDLVASSPASTSSAARHTAYSARSRTISAGAGTHSSGQ